MGDRAMPAATTFTPSRRKKVRGIVQKLILYLLAMSLAVVLVFPLFWMVSTSLKTDEEANAPKPVWLPARPQLDAYEQILSDPDWLGYIANSIFVTVLAVGGTLASVTIVAFAFSRLEWPGRNAIFYLMLSTLMLPLQATLVRQFMLSIPKELDEAALVDGASYFQIFWHVILPNTKPALTTVGLFLFVGHWNSLQLPLIYLQRRELQTLPMAILNLYNPQQTRQPWTLIMATSLLAVVPLVIVFLLVQRYFVESIVLTGTKG
jgi:multiple sugar transport system permease protein